MSAADGGVRVLPRLANLDPGHEYLVEERAGQVYPIENGRVVRRPRAGTHAECRP